MYIRCPIAEFDDPRNFIVGRIIQVDDFTENVTVAFLDPFGFRNYYENIPEKAELPYDYVKRCTLHRESYVIYRENRYKILSALKEDEWYYYYLNDLVKDALLTHEYWYTKIICPQEVLMCEVSSVEKRKYIIIGNDQTKKLKDILFKFNYTETIPSTISAFEIVNYLLDEKTVELVKSDLQHEVVDYTKDDQSYIIYRKIWKSKPQMTHYEKDYYEAEYIENCEIKKITRCNKLFEFEEIYSHKRLLEICSSNEFMMATWKLIDEKYIGDFDCHLYVITDATEIPIGLLYYHLFNDKFHISGFEVASTMRRLGIGTAIIKQFFNEYKVSSNDIFLEPLNKESEKFWKKLGIKCSLY